MLQKVDGLDNAVRQVIDHHEEELLRIWNHHKHGDDLHSTWKESTVLGDLERLLSQVDNTLPDLKRKRDRDDGETVLPSNNSPVLTDALTLDFRIADLTTDGFQNTRGPMPQMNPVTATFTSQRASRPSSATLNLHMGMGLVPSFASSSLSLKSVPPPSSASNLVDQYFTYTHCCFPVLSRPHVLRKLFESTKSTNSTQSDTGDLACLWAICAYSQQQTKHLRGQSSKEDATRMRTIARGLIPAESGPFLLGHIQALLILVLFDVGLGEWTSAWMLVGYAVRVLLDAKDVHPPSSFGRMMPTASVIGGDKHDTGSAWAAKNPTWRAVLQGCFVLDTLVSIRLDRPPHLRSDHLRSNSAQLLDEDGLEEWQPWGLEVRDMVPFQEPAFVVSCFNRLTELLMIANETIGNEVHYDTSGASGAQEVAVSRLFSLSQRYPFPIDELVRRPPHQMLLQAFHFAIGSSLPQLHVRDQQIATQQWFATVEVFEQSFNALHYCGIPSILATNRPVSTLFAELSTSWSQSASASSEACKKLLSKLSTVWPAFEISPTADPEFWSPDVARGQSTRADSVRQSMFPISPSGTSFRPSSNGALPDNFASHAEYSDPFAAQKAGTHVIEPSHYRAGSDYGQMSIDLSRQDTHTSYGMDTAAPKGIAIGSATSPSFNGDQIDALFHEMAQLDTTQWTMDRTQGLKDFGFADDSTFEAFCNDPDRLMLSDGDMGPLFNNTDVGPTGSQIPGINMPGVELGKMSFEDIFR